VELRRELGKESWRESSTNELLEQLSWLKHKITLSVISPPLMLLFARNIVPSRKLSRYAWLFDPSAADVVKNTSLRLIMITGKGSLGSQ
jgi:hypothetical protein